MKFSWAWMTCALALVAYAAPARAEMKPIIVQASIASVSSVTVKVTVNDPSYQKGRSLNLERSQNDTPFLPIAEYSKVKRSTTLKDTPLVPGKYVYRARVLLKSGKWTRWFKGGAVTIKDSAVVTPTPTPSSGASQTPTPTPTPSNQIFDSAGNVTAYGKGVLAIPTALSGNIGVGKGIWQANCTFCHAPKYSRTYPIIKYAATRPPMNFTNISDQMYADITAYLNQYR